MPVESIAEDLLGLEVERTELDVSGVLLPTEENGLLDGLGCSSPVAVRVRRILD